MSSNKQLTELKSLFPEITDDSEDDRLKFYLRVAENKVLNKLYPFRSDNTGFVPIQYASKVIEIAQYLYLRQGSEGETSHSENGISRSYENADVPDSMLKDITPMVGGFD